MSRRTVLIGQLGPTLDQGGKEKRWNRWRPSVAACMQHDLKIDQFDLILQPKFERLATQVEADIQEVSPGTKLVRHYVEIADPWCFEEVYASLFDFASSYRFELDSNDYLVHITTGTHVSQICLFLLTESRFFPAKLLQTGVDRSSRESDSKGIYSIIDLDLATYDHLSARFQQKTQDDLNFLKSGIATRNANFNILIEKIERIAIRSDYPILLMGPTGAGKSQLAQRIYELKRLRHQLRGKFVEVNCATIRGEAAMSSLFGHVRGAFTGAQRDRNGYLREAHEGLLFLDEIAELGLDEQAMLLRAIEQKSFFPLGADREVSSDFRIIAGTNQDLRQAVKSGTFREDLLARINLWTFTLPGLKHRPEDIAPNLDHELLRFGQQHSVSIRMNSEARRRYLDFALSTEAAWKANFRDLGASVARMATLRTSAGIELAVVEGEIQRLRADWHSAESESEYRQLGDLLSDDALAELDAFDRVQLEYVIGICRESRSLAEAGRKLFNASRGKKSSRNDSDRLRKYLAKFSLTFEGINGRNCS